MDRSEIMRRVKAKNTSPERTVRSLLHKMGYRFRLHRLGLPGKPDIVFPTAQKAVFVNGCFWHGHTCARGNRIPKTNRNYWIQKIQRNIKRDRRNSASLKKLGWKSLVVWECQLGRSHMIEKRLKRFLE